MSNPTSNFGWQMPTPTDLVTDLPADFEVFGQAVDTTFVDLKGGTTGQVLKKNTNADMDFVWGADSAGMTNPMTTTGDTIYSSSGSTPARLGIGSTGNVLTVAGGVPTWAAPAGGGKVLQVVSGTTTTLTTINTGTFTDTGLTATITPTLNTSKILVLISQRYQVAGGDDAGINWRILRDSTTIGTTSGTGSQYQYWRAQGVPSFNSYVYANNSFLDSPATTSATTYKTQGSGSTSIGFQSDTGLSSIILMEIGA